MAASFVLIHSPSVGPRTWQPVAHRLTELDWQATVPPLLHVTDQGPPYWPRVVDAVRAGLGTAEQGQGLVLVAHSNAGLFLLRHHRGPARPDPGLHLRGRRPPARCRCGTPRTTRAAGTVAGQGI